MIMLTVLFFLFSSCITLVPPHNTTYSSESVQEFLQKEEYARAWIETIMLEKKQMLSPLQAKASKREITQETLKKYQRALDEEDFFQAWMLHSVLEQIEQQVEENSHSLQQEIILSLLNDAQHAQALTELQRYNLVDQFANNESLSQLASSYHNMAIVDESSTISSEDFDIVSILPALVTVMVDLGTEIVQRVATREFSIGSGVFVQKDGYLLTNYHVISEMVDSQYEGYARLFILLNSSLRERIPARVIAYDRLFDLALLKVEMESEIALSFSFLSELPSGTKVLALGSPGGLAQTVTAGIISATRKEFSQVGSVLQFDASVNPGNSGGVLVKENGMVVGVIFAKGFEVEGISYAIPGYWVVHSLSRLLRSEGKIHHPWLGLTLVEEEGDIAVISVFPGSPADQGGVQEGDVLLSVNGVRLSTIPAYQGLLLGLEPGMLVSSQWQREKETIDLLLPVATRPHIPLEELLKSIPLYEALFPIAGMQLEPLRLRKRYVLSKITTVLPGSAADMHDFSPGDTLYLLDWGIEEKYLWVKMITRKKTEGFLNKSVIISFPLFSNTVL